MTQFLQIFKRCECLTADKMKSRKNGLLLQSHFSDCMVTYYLVNYPSPKGNGLGRLSQEEPISVLQRPCIGSFCIFSLSNYGRIFLYHRKNFYPRTSSHWSMFPKCTACRLSTSTSCGKLFLMIMTPFSLSCFSPPPAMPPMVRSSVKTVPSL